jgi:ADP-ribose pyrophosphatase
VFDGNLLHVRRDRVRLPDGREATREYIVHPGAVVIVPILPDGRLVLERQFRYPIGQVMLEFPAGRIDPQEAPLATAKRELIEEAGYAAATWRRLGILHPEIGYSTEAIEIFLATGLTHVGAQLDEGEFLDVVPMTEDALLAAYDRGEVTDGKTIAALFAWQRLRTR